MSAEQAREIADWLAEVRCYVILEGESETCVLQKATAQRANR